MLHSQPIAALHQPSCPKPETGTWSSDVDPYLDDLPLKPAFRQTSPLGARQPSLHLDTTVGPLLCRGEILNARPVALLGGWRPGVPGALANDARCSVWQVYWPEIVVAAVEDALDEVALGVL